MQRVSGKIRQERWQTILHLLYMPDTPVSMCLLYIDHIANFQVHFQ